MGFTEHRKSDKKIVTEKMLYKAAAESECPYCGADAGAEKVCPVCKAAIKQEPPPTTAEAAKEKQGGKN
jgi:predicted amidophosphoribosyltransferase